MSNSVKLLVQYLLSVKTVLRCHHPPIIHHAHNRSRAARMRHSMPPTCCTECKQVYSSIAVHGKDQYHLSSTRKAPEYSILQSMASAPLILSSSNKTCRAELSNLFSTWTHIAGRAAEKPVDARTPHDAHCPHTACIHSFSRYIPPSMGARSND